MTKNQTPKGPTIEQLQTEDPFNDSDPRWVYELSPEQAYLAWPCDQCQTRRDEHASEPEQSSFPELDITDHEFSAAVVQS